MPLNIQTLSSQWSDYELLDSGDRLKLERFADVVVTRSEPKAWWKPARKNLWRESVARYIDDDKKNARWEFRGKVNAPMLHLGKINFLTKFMDGSKHLGIFPEQKPHWDFIADSAGRFAKKLASKSLAPRKPTLLNLFGYTGAASIVAAASGMAGAPIRWIVDDASKFVAREIRRGKKYDAIILDPPAFGRGPKNELWKLEKMLPELLSACSRILSDTPLFSLITLYSIDASAIMAANIMGENFAPLAKSSVSCGELVLEAAGGASYPLPLSIWAAAVFE